MATCLYIIAVVLFNFPSDSNVSQVEQKLSVLVFIAMGESSKATINFRRTQTILNESKNVQFQFETVSYTDTPGYKVQFWKEKLEPNFTEAFDYIWVVDEDINFTGFNADEYFEIVQNKNALISQPALSGGSLYFDFVKQDVNSLARASLSLELACPVFRADMWNLVHEILLPHVGTSDHGLNNRFCLLPLMYGDSLATPFSTACLIIDAQPVMHENWYTISVDQNDFNHPGRERNDWGKIGGLSDITMFQGVWRNFEKPMRKM